MATTQKSVSMGTTNTSDNAINVIDTVTITTAAAGNAYTKVVTFDEPFSAVPVIVGGPNINSALGIACINANVTAIDITFRVATIAGDLFTDADVVEVSCALKGPLA